MYDQWYVVVVFEECYFVLEVVFVEYVVVVGCDDYDCVVGEFVLFECGQYVVELCIDVGCCVVICVVCGVDLCVGWWCVVVFVDEVQLL